MQKDVWNWKKKNGILEGPLTNGRKGKRNLYMHRILSKNIINLSQALCYLIDGSTMSSFLVRCCRRWKNEYLLPAKTCVCVCVHKALLTFISLQQGISFQQDSGVWKHPAHLLLCTYLFSFLPSCKNPYRSHKICLDCRHSCKMRNRNWNLLRESSLRFMLSLPFVFRLELRRRGWKFFN